MNKVYEVKTIDEAKKLAVSDFNLPESDLTFEVLKENKGFLGIGSKIEVQASCNIDGVEEGKKYLQMLLKYNDVEGFIEKKVRDNNVEFNVDAGDFNGYLIGKNARNLIALQLLVSTIVNKYYDNDNKKAVNGNERK